MPVVGGEAVRRRPKTVQRYVDKRDAGASPFEPSRRARLIDPFLEKIEELVERSHVRADVVHDDHIVPMGFAGDARTTRRAVADAKAAWSVGRRRTYRPWVPEPGMSSPSRARDVGPQLWPRRGTWPMEHQVGGASTRTPFRGERATRIELAFSAWEADVLPLNYARGAPARYQSGRRRRPAPNSSRSYPL